MIEEEGSGLPGHAPEHILHKWIQGDAAGVSFGLLTIIIKKGYFHSTKRKRILVAVEVKSFSLSWPASFLCYLK